MQHWIRVKSEYVLQVILIFHASNTTFMKFDIFKCQGAHIFEYSTDIQSSKSLWIQFEYFLNIENKMFLLTRMGIHYVYDREYKKFRSMCLFSLLQCCIFFQSFVNDDIISSFLYLLCSYYNEIFYHRVETICLFNQMQPVLQYASYYGIPVILQSNRWLRWCHRLRNIDQ